MDGWKFSGQSSIIHCFVIVVVVCLFRVSLQVVEVRAARDLDGVAWRGKTCRGYIFLLSNQSFLQDFMNQPDELWDFDGR